MKPALAGLGGVFALGISLYACTDEEPPAPEVEAPVAEPVVPAGLVPTAPTIHAKTTHPVTASPDLDQTLSLLGEVVDAHASDPENPWAIVHGLVARGEGFTVQGGEQAIPFLYENYAEITELDGERLPSFPRKSGDLDIEPHTDLVLKALTEVDVDPTTVVHVHGEEFEVGDTWKHSVKTTFLDKTNGDSSYDSPNDMPWGVQALALWAPRELRWTAFSGTQMDMDDLAKMLVHVVTSESTFMLQSMVNGQSFEKKGQGIFSYTCGGAHMVQGATYVVARGFGDQAERDKMEVQAKLLFYRFPIEIGIYAQGMKDHPEHRLVLLAQQLKFTGHWLESVHKLMAAGLYEPTAADQLVLGQAVDVLIGTTKELKALGAFDNLDEIDQKNHQLYLDLVGDSAHAVRGVELALGKQTFSY
ncbi:MAG: hypothetical protein GY913_12600 [Proteobacteria bacterium]|nr:hypothetical protein [Pseudomonadota bacterium]MCP4917745.1 hypothetical protein [Pseudomonadota bacterium]